MEDPLDSDSLITENDEVILGRLESQEPAILDEVSDYYLKRVGCATTNLSVVRLASLCAQAAFEKVLGSSRVTNKFDLTEPSNVTASCTTGKELNAESFFAAFKNSDESFIGSGLDIFLEQRVLPRKPEGTRENLMEQPLNNETKSL